MQVVIDIDEDTYKDIKNGKIYTSVRDVPQESVVAIANGTPLPKEHGRLIDGDALRNEMIQTLKKYCNANAWDVCVECERLADTIIEADGGVVAGAI